MKHKRKVIVSIFILFVAIGIGASYLYGPFVKTKKSCETFTTFCKHVRGKDWLSAKNMLMTKPLWFRVEDGAVLYWDGLDVTDIFRRARPDFRRTFQYYLLDYTMGEKVIFQGRSTAYAILKDGKIESVKMP